MPVRAGATAIFVWRVSGGRTTVSEQDAFERILASLHEAALDPANWSSASALIDEALRTHGNGLIFGDGDSEGDIRIFISWHFFRGQRHRELEREYYDVYYALDERVPRLRHAPDSRLFHTSDLLTEEEMRTSAAYNELLIRAHWGNSIHVRLDGPDESRMVWTVGNPVDGDGWSSAQAASIRRLLPHIRQSISVQQALSEAEALASSLAEMLSNTMVGVVQLDLRGRIVAANDRALDILRQGDGLSDEGGTLRAALRRDDDALRQLLARALPPYGRQGVGGTMTVQRMHLLPRLVLHINPVGEQHMDVRPRRAAALVLIVDPASRTPVDPVMVAACLGLSPAESQVAVLLAQGRTVRDIAAATGRRATTVRWHLKHIFAKLGVSRQVEIVQIVQSLAGPPARRP